MRKRLVSQLNRAQRIALLIGLGSIAIAVDRAAVTDRGGWFGYAPNTGAVLDPAGGLHLGTSGALALRLALASVWTVCAVMLLASKTE